MKQFIAFLLLALLVAVPLGFLLLGRTARRRRQRSEASHRIDLLGSRDRD